MKDGEIMNVQKVNEEIKTQQWIQRIKECRESGLPVKTWCKQNGVCEQTYYAWLKRLREKAIEIGAVSVPAKAQTFIPVKQEEVLKVTTENIIITKGDVHIEFPVHTDMTIITNIIRALVC